MLIKIPNDEPWINHLKSRVLDAKHIGILEEYVQIHLDEAMFFFPHVSDLSVQRIISVDTPLRSVLPYESIPNNVWVPRKDMIAEATQWIKEYSSELSGTWLFTEAGWSEAGDKILEQYDHIVSNSRPIFYVNINSKKEEEIQTIIRKSRSLRLLGVLTSNLVNPKQSLPLFDGYLLTDALQGDSIMLAPVGNDFDSIRKGQGCSSRHHQRNSHPDSRSGMAVWGRLESNPVISVF